MSDRSRVSVGTRVVVLAATLAVLGSLLGFTGASAAPAPSVIFVVDVSGSMSGTPIEQAKSALHQAVDALPAGTDAGLRAYAGSCGDGGDLLVPVGPVDEAVFDAAIDSLRAGGGTPTPDALRAAAADLPSEGSRTIVLISDGQSSCGNPCTTAADIAAQMGVDFRVHTVGYQPSAGVGSELECIARVTGGTYVPVTDGSALGDVLGGLVGGRTYQRYVALGDSYASGEGTRNYDPGTANTVQGRDGCHRGPEAWPRLLQIEDTNRIPVIIHAACSGAKIRDVVQRSQNATEGVSRSTAPACRLSKVPNCDWSHQPPVQISRLDSSTDLVTVTIGGNNLGFADYIRACIKTGNGCEKFPDFPVARDLCRESFSCELAMEADRRRTENALKAGDKAQVMNFLMDHVVADIQHSVIPSIRNHAPNARIVVVGYPDLFPDAAEVIETCGWFSSGERDHTARLLDRFDARLAAGVAAANAEYVSTADAMDGHELCTSDPWFVPVVSRQNLNLQENAHPNRAGQQAIADVVEAAIFG